MPPSKDFVGLVSEYVHTVAHNEAEDPSVKVMAQSTWSSLKRSAKAGARRTVSSRLSFAFTLEAIEFFSFQIYFLLANAASSGLPRLAHLAQ